MGAFAAVRAYAIRPYIIYHLFVGDSFFVGVVPFCFSLATVGAYRIRPDVGGNEMIAANKTSSFNGRIRRCEGVIVVDYSP